MYQDKQLRTRYLTNITYNNNNKVLIGVLSTYKNETLKITCITPLTAQIIYIINFFGRGENWPLILNNKITLNTQLSGASFIFVI